MGQPIAIVPMLLGTKANNVDAGFTALVKLPILKIGQGNAVMGVAPALLDAKGKPFLKVGDLYHINPSGSAQWQ